MERSCFGPIDDLTPSAPFHHLGIRLDRQPFAMGWNLDGRQKQTDLPADAITFLPAGAAAKIWWSRPVDFACLYFRPDTLTGIAGDKAPAATMEATLSAKAPMLSRLVGLIHKDAEQQHPFGKLVGDSLFLSIAGLLLQDKRLHSDSGYRSHVGDWRVRRALEYIPAHYAEQLSLAAIAQAAESSQFHLARSFRSAMHCSIWQYVIRLRVQTACGLMRNPTLSLAEIGAICGFESYSTFAASFKSSTGASPAAYRSAL